MDAVGVARSHSCAAVSAYSVRGPLHHLPYKAKTLLADQVTGLRFSAIYELFVAIKHPDVVLVVIV